MNESVRFGMFDDVLRDVDFQLIRDNHEHFPNMITVRMVINKGRSDEMLSDIAHFHQDYEEVAVSFITDLQHRWFALGDNIDRYMTGKVGLTEGWDE